MDEQGSNLALLFSVTMRKWHYFLWKNESLTTRKSVSSPPKAGLQNTELLPKSPERCPRNEDINRSRLGRSSRLISTHVRCLCCCLLHRILYLSRWTKSEKTQKRTTRGGASRNPNSSKTA